MDNYQDRIGIEFISVLGMPPVQFVELAAELGCRHIGIGLEPIVSHPGQYPAWSLRNDANLRHAVLAATRSHQVSVSLGEGFIVWPHKDIRDAAADLDLMGELGVATVNILSVDFDRGRTVDQLAAFVEMAAARNLNTTLEFLPGLPIDNLDSALAAVRQVGKPNFRLLIDAMHLFRSGSSVAEVAALDPELIGYVQLCDVPLVSKYADYATEARFERLAPGQGELPLLELLVAIPPGMMVGLEVPMLTQAKAGVSPQKRLYNCMQATRDLLRRAEAVKS